MAESDWKQSRVLYRLALDRFCSRVLRDADVILRDGALSNHERYLSLFRLVHGRDETLARIFNDSRRSTCMAQLLAIYGEGLLTDEEIATLRPESATWIKSVSTAFAQRAPRR